MLSALEFTYEKEKHFRESHRMHFNRTICRGTPVYGDNQHSMVHIHTYIHTGASLLYVYTVLVLVLCLIAHIQGDSSTSVLDCVVIVHLLRCAWHSPTTHSLRGHTQQLRHNERLENIIENTPQIHTRLKKTGNNHGSKLHLM